MRISDAMFDDCRRMVDAIAPERNRPLYLIRSEEIVGELRCSTRNCLGWATSGLSTNALADVLGNRWQGPGDAIVLDADAIASEAQPGEFARCVRNVVIHETGHLPLARPPLPLPPNYVPSDGAKQFALCRLRDSMMEAEPEPGSEHDCHGWQFCRRAIHAWHRATVADFDVPLFKLFGSRLGMSDASWYLPLLLAEAVKMKDETFETIEQTDPPRLFMALWEADLLDMKRFV